MVAPNAPNTARALRPGGKSGERMTRTQQKLLPSAVQASLPQMPRSGDATFHMETPDTAFHADGLLRCRFL